MKARGYTMHRLLRLAVCPRWYVVGESAHGSASTVQEPDNIRPNLKCQKFFPTAGRDKLIAPRLRLVPTFTLLNKQHPMKLKFVQLWNRVMWRKAQVRNRLKSCSVCPALVTCCILKQSLMIYTATCRVYKHLIFAYSRKSSRELEINFKWKCNVTVVEVYFKMVFAQKVVHILKMKESSRLSFACLTNLEKKKKKSVIYIQSEPYIIILLYSANPPTHQHRNWSNSEALLYDQV